MNKIKCVFVDEAQDLNEIQYQNINVLKEKKWTAINLIRWSKSKYLSI